MVGSRRAQLARSSSAMSHGWDNSPSLPRRALDRGASEGKCQCTPGRRCAPLVSFSNQTSLWPHCLVGVRGARTDTNKHKHTQTLAHTSTNKGPWTWGQPRREGKDLCKRAEAGARWRRSQRDTSRACGHPCSCQRSCSRRAMQVATIRVSLSGWCHDRRHWGLKLMGKDGAPPFVVGQVEDHVIPGRRHRRDLGALEVEMNRTTRDPHNRTDPPTTCIILNCNHLADHRLALIHGQEVVHRLDVAGIEATGRWQAHGVPPILILATTRGARNEKNKAIEICPCQHLTRAKDGGAWGLTKKWPGGRTPPNSAESMTCPRSSRPRHTGCAGPDGCEH